MQRTKARRRRIEELVLCYYFSMDDQMDTLRWIPDKASSFGKLNAGCKDKYLCIYWPYSEVFLYEILCLRNYLILRH
ncbi:hypothetical protein TSAR_014109 [Trichomalopsis sarcophagae]|uniref:Uncharacterized protein n=1 Tax=Trichomalopsis sarcophagae TaxID=543379 RepID=A0A232EF90_9HYME|nr:hypothetical protein TSAR_014109 [Trichomalopsis sarcophagae]